MTDPTPGKKKLGMPESRVEAEARGYRPIKDLDAFLKEYHPDLGAKRVENRQTLSAMAPIDCSQTENTGKVCRTVIGDDGAPVVVGYCYNGSCYLMGK